MNDKQGLILSNEAAIEFSKLRAENERLSKECGEWHDKCKELEYDCIGISVACFVFVLTHFFVSCYAVIISMNYFW